MSRATGLLRTVVVGAVLGPTFFANAFLATNTFPSLMYTLVAGPVLGLVLVPAVVRAMIDGGASTSIQLLRRLSAFLVTVSALGAVIMVLASPILAWVLTLGIADAADRWQAQKTSVLLVVLVAPQVVLFTVATLGAAAQQARGHYALAAAAPALENLGLIVTVGVVAVLYGPGLEFDELPFRMVVVLGVGATVAVALHAGVQVIGVTRVGLSVRPGRGWRGDPVVRGVTRRLRRSVSVVAYPSAAYFVLLSLASTVPGGVLVLQIAWAVYTVPSALGARAVTAVVLPALSEAVKRDNGVRFAEAWRQALSYATVVGVPAALLLVAFAEVVAETLSNGELRSGSLIASLTLCIAVLGVAQILAGVHEMGRQALFARLDVRGPLLAGRASAMITVSLGAFALLLPAGSPRLSGLCAAVLVADAVGAAVVMRRVRRAIRPEPVMDVRRATSTVLAAGTMLPALGAGWWLVTIDDRGRLYDLLVAAPLAALGIVLFVLSLLAVSRAGRLS